MKYPGLARELAAKQKLLDALSAEQRPDNMLRFPFQRLPPEIRNAIYRLHLVRPEKHVLIRRKDHSLEARAQSALINKLHNPDYIPPLVVYTALSILGVSRQLHDEALGIFYYHNSLSFRSVENLLGFLSSIGPTRRAFVRDIKFDFVGLGSPAAFKLLAACENLTKLDIGVSWLTSRHSRGGTLLSSWGVSHLLKIRALETVEVSETGYVLAAEKQQFKDAVRNALLQPRKTVKTKKSAAGSKRNSKGKSVVAGKKHSVEDGETPAHKKTKLVHPETRVCASRTMIEE